VRIRPALVPLFGPDKYHAQVRRDYKERSFDAIDLAFLQKEVQILRFPERERRRVGGCRNQPDR